MTSLMRARLAIHEGRPHGVKNDDVLSSLRNDVRAVQQHRSTIDATRMWYANVDSRYIERVDETRDFIYTDHGVQILKNRYLYAGEPIQHAMLRIASTLSRVPLNEHDRFTEILYHALSCGMLHVSSILAAADSASPFIVPGEACRLMVANDTYDHQTIEQMEEISRMISLGVGVGMCVNSIPRFGMTERNKIRSGFRAYAKRLNACNFVTLHERRPKIAMYLHVHCDTIFDALDLKVPSKMPLENVFFGFMIPDHFMNKVRNDEDWYLFDGSQKHDGHTLDEFMGKEYAEKYEHWVANKWYTEKKKARTVMNAIITSITESGSPYIVWSDTVNLFNNQRSLGPIKTLNLCAEITNYASVDNASSCTLLSCNVGLMDEYPDVAARIYDFLAEKRAFYDDASDFGTRHKDVARFAQMLGYVGTMALNAFMGPERRRREIGLSPLGVYDLSLVIEEDPYETCAIVTEALYKGAVQASCDEHASLGVECVNYEGSEFARGRPQWFLRNHVPRSDWSNVCLNMTLGMANSMLTAQAPTATTALLTGMCESVLLPMAPLIAKESENGRDRSISYGLSRRSMNSARLYTDIPRDVSDQLRMYEKSVPFVDHSQSTMFTLELDSQKLFDLLVLTFNAKLKTGLYYALFKQSNPTLPLLRRPRILEEIATREKTTTEGRNVDCDACTL